MTCKIITLQKLMFHNIMDESKVKLFFLESNRKSNCLYIYIYILILKRLYNIYIYIERERERERDYICICCTSIV